MYLAQDRSSDVKKIEISFVQPDAPGWIMIYMKAGEIQQEVWASYCWPPFEKLVRFFEDIMSNNLPSWFDVDQERSFKYFKALPHENENLFYFTLNDSCTRESCAHIPVEGIFERRQFITEFLERFKRFLSKGYNDILWDGGDLREISLDRLMIEKEDKTERRDLERKTL